MRFLSSLAFLLLAFAGGCATVVRPPANPQHPVTAYLIDSGRTSSLVLPNDHGSMTRYAYGDWDWYALRKTEWWRAFPALLWPTPGALGRMELTAHDMSKLQAESQNVYQLQVEKDKALLLAKRLDDDFERNRSSFVTTPSVGLDFVKYGNGYWWPSNSNHATAKWMNDLGVRTRGAPIWSSWIIQPPRSVNGASAK